MMMGMTGKGADWYPRNRSSYSFDYQTASLLRYLFGEHSHGTQISSLFFAHSEESIYIPFPQISLSSIFQYCSFQVLDFPAEQLGTAHEAVYSHTPDHFPSKQSSTKGMAQSSTHCKDCPSLLSFRDVPKGCSIASVHLLALPAYRAELSVNQAQVVSSSVS